MPTLSFDIQTFKRPPIFYVSRNRFRGTGGTQGSTTTIPLISNIRSAPSRYSIAVVENVTINIDDQANIATVTFPKDLHDGVGGEIVGDEIRIRLAQFEGFMSEVIFRGIVLEPSLEISPSADGITYDCIGMRYVLNSEVIFGLRNFDAETVHATFEPTIFNEDDRPDRSSTRKTVNGISTYLFDKGEKTAEFWRVADIIRYIFAVEVQTKVPVAANVPEINYLEPLNFIPKHFELQNEQIATAITATLRHMGPAYHWWLDDFFSHQGGSQSNFKWFVIGGLDNSNAGNRIGSDGVFSVGIPSQRDTRRTFSIGTKGEKIEDHPEYNVNQMTITESGSDIVNRVIVIGDFVRVETVLELTKDWTDDEEDEFRKLTPATYPGVFADSAVSIDVTQLKTALRDATVANVFRRFKLDNDEISAIFDDIETKLDEEFGEPKDINGEDIDWFDRTNFPPFDRELFTQQEGLDGKKEDIRMQVYGYTDFRKKRKKLDSEDKEPESLTISNGFVSWTLGTGRNSYVIDPKIPVVRFKMPVCNIQFNFPGIVYVTVVLKTNVRLFHDTGVQGDAQIPVTRIIEDERFKRVLRHKSLVPEREVEGVQPSAFDAPVESARPITFTFYDELPDPDQSAIPKVTGYKVFSEFTPEIIRDDLTDLRDFAEDTVGSLQKTEVGVSIRIPRPTATYKPGELIRRVSNSGFNRFDNSTIISVSINGRDYSTVITTTNKKV